MSADVHDLTGDKTMNANTNVKLATDDVWSARSTGGTSGRIADNGAGETYRRPHAPRSAKPKTAALTRLHFDISSKSELRSRATHRSRVSERAHQSLRLLDLIRAICRPRIGYSPTDQVSQIRRPIWSQGRTAHSSHRLPGLSVVTTVATSLRLIADLKSTQLRSKSRVDSAQPKAIPGPIPRAVQRVAFTTLRLVLTMTHVPKPLTRSANDRSLHQISRNKS